MKTLYLGLFLVSIISLFLSVKPIPSNMPLPDRLSAHPDKWDIISRDPKFKIDPLKTKESVIELLRKHSPSKSDPLLIYSFAIIAAFTSLGFIRETHFKKRQA